MRHDHDDVDIPEDSSEYSGSRTESGSVDVDWSSDDEIASLFSTIG